MPWQTHVSACLPARPTAALPPGPTLPVTMPGEKPANLVYLQGRQWGGGISWGSHGVVGMGQMQQLFTPAALRHATPQHASAAPVLGVRCYSLVGDLRPPCTRRPSMPHRTLLGSTRL